MGKLKSEMQKIEELVEDVYLFGEFHSRDSFREACRKKAKEEGILYVSYLKECIEEALDM